MIIINTAANTFISLSVLVYEIYKLCKGTKKSSRDNIQRQAEDKTEMQPSLERRRHQQKHVRIETKNLQSGTSKSQSERAQSDVRAARVIISNNSMSISEVMHDLEGKDHRPRAESHRHHETSKEK